MLFDIGSTCPIAGYKIMTTIENNMEPEEKGYEGVQTPLRRFLSDFCEAKLAVVGFFTIFAIEKI